jgi:glycosyltransferase involved in cell wall biosynthesis
MTAIAWFIFFFTVLQLMIAVLNLISRPKLIKDPLPCDEPVSVLIPVRNEENTVNKVLDDLLQQEYRNMEILVFDDESEDNSVAVVQDFMTRDSRIRLIRSGGLPDGWLGKTHACHVLSQHATGKYLLFLDADVRLSKTAVAKAVTTMKHYPLGMLSVFPQQIMETTGEKMTVPVMNYILLSLLPLVLVRISGFSSVAAANGQFMLFADGIYRTLMPHEKTKKNAVEDIAIARLYKKNKVPVACLAGEDSIQCRMYEGFQDAVQGFAKNVTAFFGNSFLLAVLFWLITTAGVITVAIGLPLFFLILYLFFYILTRVIISRISGQDILRNILFIMPQQLAMGLFIYRAAVNSMFKQTQWKGRTI